MSSVVMNQIPIIPWKGQTFNQVVTHIKKNGTIYSDNTHNIFSALPLKTYRKEIGTNSCTTSRNTTTIEELNRPGSSIVNSNSSICNGLVNIVDFNLTTNSSENIGNCASECVVGTPETNARRRVRSSGMIKKQFDLSTHKPTYYTDSRQYLNSRNKTYEQNNFHYFREGDATAVQGSSQSIANIYTTNTTTDCKRYYLSADTSFTYQWVAGNPTGAGGGTHVADEPAGQYGTFTVNLLKGFYDVSDINRVLHSQMTLNEHYMVDIDNGSKKFFINFVFNSSTKLVQLQIEPISNDSINDQGLVQPTIETNSGTRPPEWNVPEATVIPIVDVLDNGFKTLVGFTTGSYPAANQTTEYIVSSNSVDGPAIKPRYNRVYYKPNNHQYAQQGAVSSSSRITRLKYNAITNSASSYRNSFGQHVANALAYGVPANGYTVKDKLGYPLPKTPTFTSTGEQRNCPNVSIQG
ncbi:hypothetical protein OAS95_04310 [Pelagibacteraceae bacterium]|nr:hypothetical protein [Pelagibacteraceae bacterium]